MYDAGKGIFKDKGYAEMSENDSEITICPGGSAVNITRALKPIASAAGLKATVYTAMRLGRTHENPGKDLILAELGNPGLHDKTLIDSMYGTNYSTPNNLVLENGHEEHHGRAIWRRRPQTIVLSAQTIHEIDYAISHAQIVMGNSAPFEETMQAFQAARERGVTTVLDYSHKIDSKNPDRAAEIAALNRAAQMIPLADYIVAPSDAMVPGMSGVNGDELFERLAEQFGKKSFAVSDGSHDVKIMANGSRSSLTMHDVPVRISNGVGDTRDAGLVVGLAARLSFHDAVKFGCDIAELYIQQPTRQQFVQSLPEYFRHHAAQPPEKHQASVWRRLLEDFGGAPMPG